MFEIIMYGIMITTFSLCGYDIYKTSNEDKANAECQDVAYHYSADNKYVYSTHHFSIKNNTELKQNFNVTFSLCPINAKCITKKGIIAISPHHQYYSDMWDLSSEFRQKTLGTYYYRVMTDIKGYKNLHSEKTCKVRLVN